MQRQYTLGDFERDQAESANGIFVDLENMRRTLTECKRHFDAPYTSQAYRLDSALPQEFLDTIAYRLMDFGRRVSVRNTELKDPFILSTHDKPNDHNALPDEDTLEKLEIVIGDLSITVQLSYSDSHRDTDKKNVDTPFKTKIEITDSSGSETQAQSFESKAFLREYELMHSKNTRDPIWLTTFEKGPSELTFRRLLELLEYMVAYWEHLPLPAGWEENWKQYTYYERAHSARTLIEIMEDCNHFFQAREEIPEAELSRIRKLLIATGISFGPLKD